MSMSAADWTRIQRRRAGLRYASEATKEVAPTPVGTLPYGTALLIPRDVGGSKFRRTASDYTNSVDARVTDYYMKTQGVDNNAYTRFMIRRLCNCAITQMDTKTGLCASCLK
jgi:hypothetical protein